MNPQIEEGSSVADWPRTVFCVAADRRPAALGATDGGVQLRLGQSWYDAAGDTGRKVSCVAWAATNDWVVVDEVALARTGFCHPRVAGSFSRGEGTFSVRSRQF
ncbi:unnamed protein product [Soboliphyme baturini]|uniref:F5/8 type C domain-containing protein n=1 Tax=Soboliphyme baturini TaxID=241478 RepID=A0A183JAC5_9BILA|nr:unnamed protein product [Soboliphyme baturini]